MCFISAMLLLEDMQVNQLSMLQLEDVHSIVGVCVDEGTRQVECCMEDVHSIVGGCLIKEQDKWSVACPIWSVHTCE